MEGSKDNRKRSMSRLYTYAGKRPAKNERFSIYGIFGRKKRIIDILKIWGYEVYISKL